MIALVDALCVVNWLNGSELFDYAHVRHQTE